MLRRVGLLIVVLTLMVLTAGAVQATPRIAGPKPASESSGVLDRLLGWLSHLFPTTPSSPSGVKSAWDLDGSHLDPNGNH
jgi:hypothetical protein